MTLGKGFAPNWGTEDGHTFSLPMKSNQRLFPVFQIRPVLDKIFRPMSIKTLCSTSTRLYPNSRLSPCHRWTRLRLRANLSFKIPFIGRCLMATILNKSPCQTSPLSARNRTDLFSILAVTVKKVNHCWAIVAIFYRTGVVPLNRPIRLTYALHSPKATAAAETIDTLPLIQHKVLPKRLNLFWLDPTPAAGRTPNRPTNNEGIQIEWWNPSFASWTTTFRKMNDFSGWFAKRRNRLKKEIYHLEFRKAVLEVISFEIVKM